MAEREDDGAPAGLHRLPRGRHGLPREYVADNQRDRLIAGAIDAVCERGYHEATVGDMVAAAGVSRRTFYKVFDDKEDCCLAAFEEIASHLSGAAEKAAGSGAAWSDRSAAALAAVLDAFVENPRLAVYALAMPPRAGGRIAERQRSVLAQAAEALARGAPSTGPGIALSEEVARALLAGAAALAAEAAEGDGASGLRRIRRELVEAALAPYVGAGEARRAAEAV